MSSYLLQKTSWEDWLVANVCDFVAVVYLVYLFCGWVKTGYVLQI